MARKSLKVMSDEPTDWAPAGRRISAMVAATMRLMSDFS